MIIRQLSLTNFLGYRRRCELDFRGKPTVGIVGPNESGKSTILSAISYLLYGDVPVLNQETREVDLISDGATADLVVEGEVELASGEVLSLARGRTRGNSPIVRLDGFQGKPSELSGMIGSKVEVPFADFIALAYFVQGDIHQFMTGSKRDYFQRWTCRLQRWERYEGCAKSSAAALELRLQQLDHDEARHRVTTEDVSEAARELEIACSAQAETSQREALLRSQTDALGEEVAELTRCDAERVAAARGAEREASHVSALIASQERRAAVLAPQTKETRAGVCPVLREPCDRLVQRGDAKRGEARRELQELQVETARTRDLQAQLAKQIQAERVHKPDDGPARALAGARRDLGEAVNAACRAARRLGCAEERVATLESHRSKVKDIQASIAEAEGELRRVRFIQAMCGRSGIPMDVMEAEIGVVEDKCNWVLDRLDYPKQVRFAAYRELAGFEKVCPYCGGEAWRDNACLACDNPRPHKRKDEPTVTVLDGGVERAFSLESGGAQVLQSFAVRLACSLFRASLTGAQVRMVMLDEVFAMLDASNRQKLMSLVVGKLSSEFGLRQQFIVSHQEDVVNAVDDIIVVHRSGGSSVATWA